MATSRSKTRIFQKFHTNKKLLRCQRRMRTIWDCSWVEVINKIADNRRKAKITGSMPNNITSNSKTIARSSSHSRATAGSSDSRATARSSSHSRTIAYSGSNSRTLALSSIHSRTTAGSSDRRATARSSSQIIKSTKSKIQSRGATAGRKSRPTKVMPVRKMMYPTITHYKT